MSGLGRRASEKSHIEKIDDASPVMVTYSSMDGPSVMPSDMKKSHGWTELLQDKDSVF